MIHIHASGILLSAPQSRQSAKGNTYTTGMLKSITKDGDAVVSFICFSESEQQALLELAAGDCVTVSGNAKLTSWFGKDGAEKYGLSVVADQVLAHVPQADTASKPRRTWPPQARKTERAFGDADSNLIWPPAS